MADKAEQYNIGGASLTLQADDRGITITFNSGDADIRSKISSAIGIKLVDQHLHHEIRNTIDRSDKDEPITSIDINNQVTLITSDDMGGAELKLVTPGAVRNILNDLGQHSKPAQFESHYEELVRQSEERLRSRRPHPDDTRHAARLRKKAESKVEPYLRAVIKTLADSGINVDETLRAQLQNALVIAREGKMRGGGFSLG